MIKYRATQYSSNIEEIEVTRETDKNVWVKRGATERQEAKSGNSWQWADTKEQALKYLYDYHIRHVESAKMQLERSEKSLRDFLLANEIGATQIASFEHHNLINQ